MHDYKALKLGYFYVSHSNPLNQDSNDVTIIISIHDEHTQIVAKIVASFNQNVSVFSACIAKLVNSSPSPVFVSRGPTLGEIPYALGEINFEITKLEAC